MKPSQNELLYFVPALQFFNLLTEVITFDKLLELCNSLTYADGGQIGVHLQI